MNNTIKMKNKIFAIPAAPAAIPPKPKTPATNARIINMIVQRNIIISFIVNTCFSNFDITKLWHNTRGRVIGLQQFVIEY